MSVGVHEPRLTASQPKRRAFRTDIQALRALAIGLVVLNHLWPTRLTGGYVGVDVFFVISGFLITGHIVAEISRSGRIGLGAFYARRIRRLLPAAFLVLVVSLTLVVIFLPYPRWERNAWEVAASAGYVENWFLAAMSVNYSALNDAASVVQHYWSLSVEEQFYIVWPVLLLATAAVARRFLRGRVAPWIIVAICAVGVLSLGASIIYTVIAPAQAYFATFTRGWEFAAGGVIALVSRNARVNRLTSNVMSLLGFALIAFSALIYNAETSFPGYAALVPVAGTAAVILAGARGDRLWHTNLTAMPPVQWLGGISYSLYLWHWPLIVVAPFVLGAEASTVSKLAVLVLSLLLAALTKRVIEDGGQRWGFWAHSTKKAILLMIVGMLVISAVVSAVLVAANIRAQADLPPEEVTVSSCEGPAALAPDASCDDAFGPADYTVMTTKNEYFFTPEECGDFWSTLTYADKKTTMTCDFSEGAAEARQVWLVGDSHAQQWQGAIFDIAREEDWVVTTSYLGGCPAADVDFVGFRGEWGATDIEACRSWSREVAAAVVDAAPDAVITAMATRQQLVDDGSEVSNAEQMVNGLVRRWQQWNEAGVKVLALGDPPYNGEVRDPDCVLLNEKDPATCARPRAEAQPEDPIIVAAQQAAAKMVRGLDLTDSFCDSTSCYAVVGGIPVYYDADHLNLEYVRMLRPQIQTELDALLAVEK